MKHIRLFLAAVLTLSLLAGFGAFSGAGGKMENKKQKYMAHHQNVWNKKLA